MRKLFLAIWLLVSAPAMAGDLPFSEAFMAPGRENIPLVLMGREFRIDDAAINRWANEQTEKFEALSSDKQGAIIVAFCFLAVMVLLIATYGLRIFFSLCFLVWVVMLALFMLPFVLISRAMGQKKLTKQVERLLRRHHLIGAVWRRIERWRWERTVGKEKAKADAAAGYRY